jgi:gamma-glutamyltranspeptidase/glutathione hydrolase
VTAPAEFTQNGGVRRRLKRRSLMKLRIRLSVLIISFFVAPLAFGAGMQPEHAQHGMVVSIRELASQAGVEILKAGGNAVDAAVATGFALAVVHPAAGNLGGGGFMLVRMADGETHFLDYREKAPAKATATMYQDAQGNVIPSMSRVGYKAIGVPGSVKGMVEAEKRFGKLGLKQVVAPAIRLAREGYALTWSDARQMTSDSSLAQYPRLQAHLPEQRQRLAPRRHLQAAAAR